MDVTNQGTPPEVLVAVDGTARWMTVLLYKQGMCSRSVSFLRKGALMGGLELSNN